MLTSHHYLLSGFCAVLCATAMGTQSSPLPTALAQQQTSIPPTPMNATTPTTVDLAYRGSGRIQPEPLVQPASQGQDAIAHRGSGRIVPQFL
jgi:hypothetical protein